MHNLGVLLQKRGDIAEAEHWWRRAAGEDAQPDAMFSLGVVLYQRGDLAHAEQWWRRAADEGHSGAMFNLGVLLRARAGDDNLADAEHWFERARRHGVEDPQ